MESAINALLECLRPLGIVYFPGKSEVEAGSVRWGPEVIVRLRSGC